MKKIGKLSLYAKTLCMFQDRSRRVSINDISAATGLSEAWLSIFGQGKVTDPSVNNVQALYEYLIQDTLKV